MLWIAANELPLRPELLPFLVARSGRALAEFALWASNVKGPAWIADVLQELPMGTELIERLDIPTDPAEQRRLHAEFVRRLVRLIPEAADEAEQQAIRQSLQHQFERRLGRPLTAAEEAVMRQRLTTLGSNRLGDVVLDLDARALVAWLADPAAH